MNKTEIELQIETLKVEKDKSIKQQDYLRASELTEPNQRVDFSIKKV